MMKTLPILLLFSCLLTFGAIAQQPQKDAAKHDSVAYYMYDQTTMAINPANANFLRLIIKKGSGTFEIQDYYADGTPRLLATSYSGDMNFEKGTYGIYTEFYLNGKKKYVRNYDKGKVIGADTTFYDSGKPYNIVIHSTSGNYLKTCIDTTGKILADNGNGNWVKYHFDGEQETFTGDVINGKEEGVWIHKYPGDTTNYKVEYKNGVVLPGAQSRPPREIFQAIEQQPGFPGGDMGLSKYLAKTLKYPDYAREHKITGRVILTFVVEKTGRLSEFNVTSSPDESLSNEALRVMKASPVWKPGIQNSLPVRVRFSMPITFTLSKE